MKTVGLVRGCQALHATLLHWIFWKLSAACWFLVDAVNEKLKRLVTGSWQSLFAVIPAKRVSSSVLLDVVKTWNPCFSILTFCKRRQRISSVNPESRKCLWSSTSSKFSVAWCQVSITDKDAGTFVWLDPIGRQKKNLWKNSKSKPMYSDLVLLPTMQMKWKQKNCSWTCGHFALVWITRNKECWWPVTTGKTFYLLICQIQLSGVKVSASDPVETVHQGGLWIWRKAHWKRGYSRLFYWWWKT